ncbi:hypothetical protein T265_09775 [Opisthorchis viverrini]|uniref:Uncharacterized protein n=1 Tax=Opisthorchis viverrini TaxID=6198 RepID=A0A074Z8V6_OPIVI|nr:hypothetical protein T265_09775 [Opisthorchis viverrini]KER22022.1 hypothetical protein T265_09775 [Opisthorchis viverrini]
MFSAVTRLHFGYTTASFQSRSVYHNIRLTETRGLCLPDEPQEGRNRSWAVEEFSATLGVVSFMVYLSCGKRVTLHLFRMLELGSDYSRKVTGPVTPDTRLLRNRKSIKETTHKFAENSSIAHDRFRLFGGSSNKSSPRVSVNFMFYLSPNWNSLSSFQYSYIPAPFNHQNT